MSFDIGQNAVLGIALQDETGGATFGQAALSYDYIRIKPGGFTYEPRNSKTPVEELNVDPTDMTVGGLYYTWTAEMVMSYSYREKWFMLALGSDDDYGAGPPMIHETTPVDKLRFGSLKFVYSDEEANDDEWIAETFSNAAVTSISLGQNPEGELTISVSGLATAMAQVRNFAGQSITVRATEPVAWAHLTATLDGVTTQRLGSVGIDLNCPLTEGEFDLAASTPNTMAFVGRSGPREIKWAAEPRVDSATETLVGDTSGVWDSANSLVWNNGAAAADNRQLSFIFGNSYVDGASKPGGEWGRITRALSLIAMDGTTRVLTFKTTNALSGEIVVT